MVGSSTFAVFFNNVRNKDHWLPSIVAHVGLKMANALDYAYSRTELKGEKLQLIH